MAETKLAMAVDSDEPSTQPTEQSNPAARAPKTLLDIITAHLSALQQTLRDVVATGEVEAIHRMRVTTRRLQASLDLVQNPRDTIGVRKIKRRLRNWRRMLSEVRNYDVFLDLLSEHAGRKTHHATAELLKTRLSNRRERRALRIRARLERANLDKIASKLGLALPVLPTIEASGSDTEFRAIDVELEAESAAPTPRPELEDVAAISIRAASRLEQRLGEFQVMAAESHPTTDPVELHALRIAAKRLRYLLEIATETGYGEAPKALAYLKSLHDRIGDWHDLEALEDEIIAMVSQPRFVKANLDEGQKMLRAAADLQKYKESLARKLFPIKPPSGLSASSNRLVRSMRRRAAKATR